VFPPLCTVMWFPSLCSHVCPVIHKRPHVCACLTVQLCMYCMVLTLFRSNCCLHVLIVAENGDVCAAEGQDLKEKENYVC